MITTGTRSRTQRLSSSDSWPWSWAARSPAWLVSSTTRSRASSRKIPTVRISGGSRFAMSAARDTARNRGDDGTKLKPTASAPMATARRASSSDVMPQTLTNTRWRLPTRHAEIGDRLRRIAGGHERLADQHRVEAGLGEPARVVGPAMPDSATRSTPSGIDAPTRTARSVSTSKVTRSRWFTPMRSAPDAERPLELGLVVHLDERVEAPARRRWRGSP